MDRRLLRLPLQVDNLAHHFLFPRSGCVRLRTRSPCLQARGQRQNQHRQPDTVMSHAERPPDSFQSGGPVLKMHTHPTAYQFRRQECSQSSFACSTPSPAISHPHPSTAQLDPPREDEKGTTSPPAEKDRSAGSPP